MYRAHVSLQKIILFVLIIPLDTVITVTSTVIVIVVVIVVVITFC